MTELENLASVRTMSSNEQIIKEFLTKMATQDNRGTAFPIYYVIRTENEVHAPLENCDYTRWYYIDSSYESLDELKEQMRQWDYSEEEIKKSIREACEYGVKKVWEKRGMFLTETDAEQHLKLNHYHYSSNAHTYVEHAWRAPELTGFFHALFDHFGIGPKDERAEKKS